jgi:hypothetical protein
MHHWKDAAALQLPPDAKPLDQLTSVWARAIGAGFMHDVDGTRKDLEQYDSLVQSVRKSKEAYLADQLMGVPRDEISAWVAFADTKNDEAVRLMRRAADRQDAEGKAETDIPARETGGETGTGKFLLRNPAQELCQCALRPSGACACPHRTGEQLGEGDRSRRQPLVAEHTSARPMHWPV